MARRVAGEARKLDELSLEIDGAQLFCGAAQPVLTELESSFRNANARAGTRLQTLGPLRKFFEAKGCIGQIASAKLGANTRPVRAIAFNKTKTVNWSLGWHQDRTICVAERHDHPGFGPWTKKRGMIHVEPPFELLAKMLTFRIHVDAVDESNAPLQIVRGSHTLGLVRENAINEVVRNHTVHSCVAEKGDIWVYSTPILHASSRTDGHRSRRVLQVDFAAEDLPRPLVWSLE